MEVSHVLSLGQKPVAARPRIATPDLVYVEVAEQAAPPKTPQIRHRKPRRQFEAHERGMARALVLGSFLGPQFYREDDGSYVAPYTTEKTRDSFPRRLLEDLAVCQTEGGPDGRLPADYVASLARGTTRMIASETRPKKKGAIPLGPFAFQDAHVVKAVGAMATEYGQWLRYGYGDSKEWDDEAGLVVALWQRVEPQLGKIQAKTRKSVKALAHLAVQNFRSLVNSGKTVHPAFRLRELLGVSESNWDQHWAKRWQLCEDELWRLDAEALADLLKRLDGYEFVLVDRGI
jgi:hypothetical protein